MVGTTRRASAITVRCRAGSAPDGGPADAIRRAETLAAHLIGHHVAPGQALALPGWPPMSIDHTLPDGAVRVTADTLVDIWWPPKREHRPVCLLFVIDGSYTMSRGRPGATHTDQAAWAIESTILNTHPVVDTVAMMVHGQAPRWTGPFVCADELNAHAIHKVPARGRFDHAKAIGAGVDLLAAQDTHAPKELVLVTDGHGLGPAVVRAVRDAGRRSVRVHVLLTRDGGSSLNSQTLGDLATAGAGVVTDEPEDLARELAAEAGSGLVFHGLPPPTPVGAQEEAFEIIIETLEEDSI